MKRVAAGIFIILIALGVLLVNLDVGNSRDILSDWWPAYLIAGGLLLWITDRSSYLWAAIVTIIGAGFLLDNLDVVSINVGQFVLPGILLAIGGSMIIRSLKPKPVGIKSSDELSAILSGVQTKNVSKEYTGSKLTAVLGGIELDLSKAVFQKNATIDVFALMGGIDLRLPENVVVKPKAVCLLGGIEDKSSPVDSKDSPELLITGNIIMGGIEIKR